MQVVALASDLKVHSLYHNANSLFCYLLLVEHGFHQIFSDLSFEGNRTTSDTETEEEADKIEKILRLDDVL